MKTAKTWLVGFGWVLCFCALLSCSKSAPSVEATDNKQPAQGDVKSKSATEPEPSMEQVPVREDFEEEVKSSIDEKNYREELARLTEEIGKK